MTITEALVWLVAAIILGFASIFVACAFALVLLIIAGARSAANDIERRKR